MLQQSYILLEPPQKPKEKDGLDLEGNNSSQKPQITCFSFDCIEKFG